MNNELWHIVILILIFLVALAGYNLQKELNRLKDEKLKWDANAQGRPPKHNPSNDGYHTNEPINKSKS